MAREKSENKGSSCRLGDFFLWKKSSKPNNVKTERTKYMCGGCGCDKKSDKKAAEPKKDKKASKPAEKKA